MKESAAGGAELHHSHVGLRPSGKMPSKENTYALPGFHRPVHIPFLTMTQSYLSAFLGWVVILGSILFLIVWFISFISNKLMKEWQTV